MNTESPQTYGNAAPTHSLAGSAQVSTRPATMPHNVPGIARANAPIELLIGDERAQAQQLIFIKTYAETLNIRRAAEVAGVSPSTARNWLRDGKIKDQVAGAMSADGMMPSEVIARLSKHAQASLADYITVEDNGYWRVDMAKVVESGAHGISEISYDANGLPKIKMMDRLHALELVARIRGMFTDRVEVDVRTQTDVRIRQETMREAMADPALLRKLGELAEALRAKRLPDVEAIPMPETKAQAIPEPMPIQE